MNWFLLKTKPNAHNVASENLQRQGFEVFMPLMVKTSKRNGKFVNSLLPLFPNYLFMGTELEEVYWRSVNSTRGISKAVTLDGKYRIVNFEIIEGLKRRCNKSGIIQTQDRIMRGDQVRVENGPFAEFICQVEQISENRRAWVLIDILQQKTRAKFLLSDLSKIS